MSTGAGALHDGLASQGPSTKGGLGERRLSTMHAIGQSLAIGPIFSAGLLTGLIAAVAGFSTPASVLLASIGAICLSYVLSVYARRYAGAGAIYEYLTRAGRPGFGVLCAMMYFLAMPLMQGSFALFVGFQVNGFWVSHISSTGAPAWWVFGLVYIAVFLVMNYFGVKLAIRAILALAALSAIPMIVLAVSIIAQGGAHGQALETFNPFRGSFNAVLNGVLFGVTLFIGFEVAAALGEETKTPRRSIPIALLTTVGICAAFYLLMSYAATIGFGENGISAWVGSPDAMGLLATRYVGHGLATIIDLVIILDLISAGLAFSVAATRGIYALARDQFLPRPLATTTPYGTPAGAMVAVTIAALGTMVWAAVTHLGDAAHLPNVFMVIQIIVAAGSFVIELIYVFLAVWAFRLMHQSSRGPRDWWRYLVTLIALAVPILAFKGALDPWPSYPNIGIYVAFGIAALAAAWFGWVWATRREHIQQAGAYATAEHELELMGPESVEQLSHSTVVT